MKLKILLPGILKKITSTKSTKEDSFSKIGREQFKKLLERGLSIPVVLL